MVEETNRLTLEKTQMNQVSISMTLYTFDNFEIDFFLTLTCSVLILIESGSENAKNNSSNQPIPKSSIFLLSSIICFILLYFVKSLF